MTPLIRGIPAVLLPIYADQPRNAERVAALGAGITLSAAERTSERIRAVARIVLDEEHYRSNAQQLKRRLETLPSVDSAARLLERFAEDRLPILCEA